MMPFHARPRRELLPSRSEVERRDDPREGQPRRLVQRRHRRLRVGLEQAQTARLADKKQAAQLAHRLPRGRELPAALGPVILERQAVALADNSRRWLSVELGRPHKAEPLIQAHGRLHEIVGV